MQRVWQVVNKNKIWGVTWPEGTGEYSWSSIRNEKWWKYAQQSRSYQLVYLKFSFIEELELI